MKMKKLIIFTSLILQVAVFSSCSTFKPTAEQKLSRLLNKYPQLAIKDSIPVIDSFFFERVKLDTIIQPKPIYDTTKIVLGKYTILHSLTPNNQVYLSLETPADTMILNRKYPAYIIKQVKPDHLSIFLNKLPWLALIILAIVALVRYLFPRK